MIVQILTVYYKHIFQANCDFALYESGPFTNVSDQNRSAMILPCCVVMMP